MVLYPCSAALRPRFIPSSNTARLRKYYMLYASKQVESGDVGRGPVLSESGYLVMRGRILLPPAGRSAASPSSCLGEYMDRGP